MQEYRLDKTGKQIKTFVDDGDIRLCDLQRKTGLKFSTLRTRCLEMAASDIVRIERRIEGNKIYFYVCPVRSEGRDS